MARFAINTQGVNSLNCLANDLLINANNIVEANEYLEKSILCLYEQLGIYGDEMLAIVVKNRSTLDSNREEIINLALKVKKQAESMENLINSEFGVVDTSISEKGILNKLIDKLFWGSVLKGQYASKDDIPQKDYVLIEDYVTDGNSINRQIRAGNETKDITSLRNLIRTHMISDDMILYRRSSRSDFNDLNLLNCPLEDLVGKRITFSGFMSTTPNSVHAKKSNTTSNFEIKFIVSKGMEALDLSNLSYNEVIFNDKINYIIEDAQLIGNTEHIVARIIGYDK